MLSYIKVYAMNNCPGVCRAPSSPFPPHPVGFLALDHVVDLMLAARPLNPLGAAARLPLAEILAASYRLGPAISI